MKMKKMNNTNDYNKYREYMYHVNDKKSIDDIYGVVDKVIHTQQFKKWFGDWENDIENSSKIVDMSGKPLVVFHGSKKDFNTFDISHFGETDTCSAKGFYFTPQKFYADTFGTSKVFFLNVRKPLIIKDDYTYALSFCFGRDNIGDVLECIKSWGYEDTDLYHMISEDMIQEANQYDGVISSSDDEFNTFSNGIGNEIVIKNPNQAKSINSLNFNIEDDNFMNESHKHKILKENIVENLKFKRWFGKSKAVDLEGNPLEMHHLTDSEFNTFSHDHIRGGASAYHGFGFNFSRSRFGGYGKNDVVAYLRAIKPLTNKRKTIRFDKLYDIIRKADEGEDADNTVVTSYIDRVCQEDRQYQRYLYETVRKILEYAENDLDIYAAVCQGYGGSKKKMIDVWKSYGYDSAIEYDNYNHLPSVIVVFYPNQVKSVKNTLFNKKDDNMFNENKIKFKDHELEKDKQKISVPDTFGYSHINEIVLSELKQLNESRDCIFYKNKNYNSESPNARPFMIYNNRLILGDFGKTHCDTLYKKMPNLSDIEIYNIVVETDTIGRIFYVGDEKIVAFNPSCKHVMQCLNALFTYHLIKIDDKTFISLHGDEFIPITEYIENNTNNKKLESKQLNEDRDRINFHGDMYQYDDDDVISKPFMYYKGKFLVGCEGGNHEELLAQELIKQSGNDPRDFHGRNGMNWNKLYAFIGNAQKIIDSAIYDYGEFMGRVFYLTSEDDYVVAFDYDWESSTYHSAMDDLEKNNVILDKYSTYVTFGGYDECELYDDRF